MCCCHVFRMAFFVSGWKALRLAKKKEAVDEACFRLSLKHASLWSEIFKKIGVEGDADGHLLGEKGVVVGGQRSCTKHVSGLV